MTDLREQLKQCFQGRVCLMGVGNTDCGDDGFGVRLAEELLKCTVQNSHVDGSFGLRTSDFALPFKTIVAGTTPERLVSRVIEENVDHLIFLDAVEFGAAPGSVVFLNSMQMAARFPQFSTHKISLGMLAKWAESNGSMRAWLLGVQPESLKSGAGLTLTVQRTLEMLVALLTELAQEKRVSVLECGGPPPLSHEARRNSADHTRTAKWNALVQKRQRNGALRDAIALSSDVGCCAPAQSTIGNRQSTIPC
jgi:hydrogenase maturation protease